jgi:hypothetical protein
LLALLKRRCLLHRFELLRAIGLLRDWDNGQIFNPFFIQG